jgi:uncharacterized protein
VKLGPIEVEEGALEALCEKWGIERLEAFGSVLRPDFRPESDIDLLATFHPGVKLSFRILFEAEREFGAVLGRRVELVSRPAVEAAENHIRRNAIFKSAVKLVLLPGDLFGRGTAFAYIF